MISRSAHHVRVAAIGTGVLILNSAYLAATASPTLFYFTNVVAHIALGCALALFWTRAGWREWPRLTVWMRTAAAVLLLGAITGTAIVFLGAAGRMRWLLPVHIALVLAGG